MRTSLASCAAALAAVFSWGASLAAERAYRLPSVDLKPRVIWGSSCEGPEGTGLAFGGQDQEADDGRPHTRVKQPDQWVAIHQQLRARNPLQTFHDRLSALVAEQRKLSAQWRRIYFEGLPREAEIAEIAARRLPSQRRLAAELKDLGSKLRKAAGDRKDYEARQAQFACRYLESAEREIAAAMQTLPGGVTPEAISRLSAVAVALEKTAEALDAEPPPRALSPIVYDPRTKLYLLFGGDHCDYLTNDTWVFDAQQPQWQQRHPPGAPPPRANHQLAADRTGKIALSGGYTYTSNTDYCGGQYRDHHDGPWTYDVQADRWSGPGAMQPADGRVYRTGPFDPDFYLQGPKPDAAVVRAQLESLPTNTWVSMDPLQRPRLNRDWGSAVLDADHDLILRWSGGHSAHGGTDVLHYHCATNRWELPIPVEFPLGQLYSNTSYPEGFNFNRRPWITGHTYQSYAYDTTAARMIFVGQTKYQFFYDPLAGDWVGRDTKPKGMSYNSCFYDLTLCATPKRTYCWTKNGELFCFDAVRNQWEAVELEGAKLPGAVVDNSTLAYDSRRDRLLLVCKPYGDPRRYDGQVYAVELKTRRVSALSPNNASAAVAVPYLCQLRYDMVNDLLLVGGTLPPGPDGLRRTPAYDCAGNRWITLRIVGQDPSGKQGRNVSLGLMYDAKRKIFWAVDTDSRVFVLRLEPKTAEVQPL